MATPAELAQSFERGLTRMNNKITQVDTFMTAATPKYTARRLHGLMTRSVRVNGDGTLEYYDGTVWHSLSDGTAIQTPWFLLSCTNGRDHGTFAAMLSSQLRHKTDQAQFRVGLDLVYAGSAYRPDPEFPNDTGKVIPITDAYLHSLWNNRGRTIIPGQNNLAVVNTYLHTYMHPAIGYSVGQSIHARIRVHATDAATGTTPSLANTLNAGEIFRFMEACHFPNI